MQEDRGSQEGHTRMEEESAQTKRDEENNDEWTTRK